MVREGAPAISDRRGASRRRPHCTVHIVADGDSATAMVGAALRRVSRHAGSPQWEICRGIHIFNVGRQARATRGVYTVKPES